MSTLTTKKLSKKQLKKIIRIRNSIIFWYNPASPKMPSANKVAKLDQDINHILADWFGGSREDQPTQGLMVLYDRLDLVDSQLLDESLGNKDGDSAERKDFKETYQPLMVRSLLSLDQAIFNYLGLDTELYL